MKVSGWNLKVGAVLVAAIVAAGLAAPGKMLENITRLRFGTAFRSSVGLSRDVYIAIRPDNPPCSGNLCGSGTKEDAYDASTRAKLDAAWPVIKAAAPKSVTFLPSTTAYLTNGSLGAIPNCVISGYGAILKADTGMAVSGSKRWIIGTDSVLNPACDGMTVEGFKFDNNINNQATTTNISVGAICVIGSHNRFLNNTFVGWGQTSASLEIFVLGCFSSDTVASIGTEVAGNKFTEETTPITQGAASSTLIAVSYISNTAETQPSSKWSYGGKIHDNQFYNINTLPGLVTGIGLGAWSAGEQVYNNFFVNSIGFIACIRADTGSSVDQSVHDNWFINVSVAIQIETSGGLSHTQTNLAIERNHCFITPWSVGGASYGIVLSGGPFVRPQISGNYVDRYGSTGSTSFGLGVYDTTDAVVVNNTSLNSDHNRISGHTRMGLRSNTFNSLEDLGGTALSSASNLNSDGTRLAMATDTDVCQGGNATVNNINVLQTAAGSGAGLTGTRPNAGDVQTPLRNINDVSWTVLTGNGDSIGQFIKLTAAREVNLPSANLCAGCFRTAKDSTNPAVYGGASANTYNITITPDIEGETQVIDVAHGAITVFSDGTDWHVWSRYSPP
jgi:hypothetical protein